MGQFGFSYVGALFLAALLVPNLFWTWCKPVGYGPSNRLLRCWGPAISASTCGAGVNR